MSTGLIQINFTYNKREGLRKLNYVHKETKKNFSPK